MKSLSIQTCIWGLKIKRSALDRKFSNYIRQRDSWRCCRCGTFYPEGDRQGLHNSHFHGRRKASTRFDPDNCDALCFGCHQFFHENRGVYATWKFYQLGEVEFEMLEARARKHVKLDLAAIRIWLDYEVKKLEEK